MTNMGNMMNCAAKFITSSGKFLIYQVIEMKNKLQNSTFGKICITSKHFNLMQ